MIRLLLLADTHLGFDLPFKPRIERRRRGHDFFANFERALEPAMQGDVDLVVHGGDLLFRSRVPAALVDQAITPLVRVADLGVPVFLVPGNHERSRIPIGLWGYHPNLHIFNIPRTFSMEIGGARLSLGGFPFARRIRDEFRDLVSATGLDQVEGDLKLLCIHQAVEGAQVGPSNYTFRSGPDVIRGGDIPGYLAAVLSGHIHRAQVLTQDLRGWKLPAPVYYPGSIERTSSAERGESKGYLLMEFQPPGPGKPPPPHHRFIPLPARPMIDLHLNPERIDRVYILNLVQAELRKVPPDSIVRIFFDNLPDPWIATGITSADLRNIAPELMNISLAASFRSRSDQDG